jgi:hypothetical protein
MPLFELTNAYDAVYKWFDYLSDKGGAIIGYVVVPNHLHLLMHLPAAFKTPNAVVGNAKRFLSYEIVKRLEAQGAEPLLQDLHAAVKKREAKKGQIHRVFEESFDCKACYSTKFIEQKLTYMHHNPGSRHRAVAQSHLRRPRADERVNPCHTAYPLNVLLCHSIYFSLGLSKTRDGR